MCDDRVLGLANDERVIRWYGFHYLLVSIPPETRIVDLVLNICQVSRVLGTVNSTYLGLYGPVAKKGREKEGQELVVVRSDLFRPVFFPGVASSQS